LRKVISYGKQDITPEDIDAVVDVLKGDFLTQGPKIKEFEEKFSKYIGCKYSIAVSNGTAALHLCAIALNVNKNSRVITTPITFSASANCVKYCGGEVEFIDIDPETYLLDYNKVKEALENSPLGTYCGIILVDFAGRSVNTELFRNLAEKYNLWIIEDACHAPGANFIDSKGVIQNSGNGVYADLSIFSFHPVKHIACGEGGMITTNDFSLYNRIMKLRTHGITKNSDQFINSIELATFSKDNLQYPGWYMEMQELGYNYRLTDFQAALGISQLSRASNGLVKRIEIAKTYDEAFVNNNKIKTSLLQLNNNFLDKHAYHLYIIEVENRLGLYNFLRENNIFSQVHYFPIHLMPYYQNLGWKKGDLLNAENYYKNCLSLPIYPTLTSEEQQFIIEKINSFCK